jgi:hypothetical protein
MTDITDDPIERPPGGCIESVTIDGHTYPFPVDADGNRKLPSLGKPTRVITAHVNGRLQSFEVEIDDSRGDREFLQDLIDTNADGSVGVAEIKDE